MDEWAVVDQFDVIEDGVIVCPACNRPIQFPVGEEVTCFRCPYCTKWACLRYAVTSIRHDILENPEKYKNFKGLSPS